MRRADRARAGAGDIEEGAPRRQGEAALAVVAAKDPQAPNWLDTAGNTWGIMQMRWNQCSDAPEPQVTKVPPEDVRKDLPASTPVVKAEQRKA